MRAVDTNVVVRYLTGDDPVQAARARIRLEQEPVFIPRTVMLEAEWVLRGVYDLPASQVVAALRSLAGLPGVAVEDSALVARAMDWAEAGMDFADALHLSAAAGCDSFLSFDKRLSRAAVRLRTPRVTAP